MPCSWSKMLTLLCLFSSWQFFSLVEQDILHHTKEVFSVMCLRCANDSRICCLASFPAMKTSTGWLPCHPTKHLCHSFKLTFEVEELESLECYCPHTSGVLFSFDILTRSSTALPWTRGFAVVPVMLSPLGLKWNIMVVILQRKRLSGKRWGGRRVIQGSFPRISGQL